MNRRDLLKFIGIGGVGVVANVVSGKEAEATSVEIPAPKTTGEMASLQDTVAYLNALYGDNRPAIIGSSSCYDLGTINYSSVSGTTIPLSLALKFGSQEYDFGGDE